MPAQPKPVYLSLNRTKGSGMTCIEGLLLSQMQKEALLKDFKKRLGCGGTVKNGVLELQGDRRDRVEAELKAKDYQVKRKGG